MSVHSLSPAFPTAAARMNRIDQRFAELKAAGRTGLIPFVTAGDPRADIESNLAVLRALVDAGADLVELGMPFSDPMADGPAIQRASERALARRVGLTRVLEIVRAFRAGDARTPLVLMGYLNPIEIRGVAGFADEAAAAGVDGLLLVDAPQDDEALLALLQDRRLHLIRLVAPTTGPERMRALARRAGGFLYFVSMAGTTGAARVDAGAIEAQVVALRHMAPVPVAVGFGIKDAESARAVAHCADAVVIGSALVDHLARAADAAEAAQLAAQFIAPIRTALDARQAA